MSEWQPIETAPKDGNEYLFRTPRRSHYVAFWVGTFFAVMSTDNVLVILPKTADEWTELPEDEQ